MAQSRTARLMRAQRVGPQARLLTFALPDGELGFSGGQYIIVNTGIGLAGGKLAKRAYSILSSDAEQREFQIAVRRIGDGPGSNFMHHLEAGAELAFSGPWGKFVTNGESPGPRLVFATDTGITAALGLLRGCGTRALADDTTAIWFVESDDYFLPPSFTRESLAGLCGHFSVAAAPAAGDAARVGSALAIIDRRLATTLPSTAFLAGDGGVIYPIRERLVAAGMQKENLHLEAFFNNPERKAPS
ncbi:MAG TPA: FAD-dependent oxidoreductase [Candidatus Binataceae bacterium]|nr:FAD-dependent oxidoreductase [Candidatus Binataceae bacterium]